MLLRSAACGPLENNCYILAPDEGRECVIIDPGMDSKAVVTSVLAQHHLTPVAVLATHGHIDHIGDAARLADAHSIPVWIHSEDRLLLSRPASGLRPDGVVWLTLHLIHKLSEPAKVELLDDQETLDLAGLHIGVVHAPGHTLGSVLFTVSDDDQTTTLAFTGDVLFAGSVGRTDLPVSDRAAMRSTLSGPVLSLPDQARILPGHGRTSTMADERATNPYLQERYLRKLG